MMIMKGGVNYTLTASEMVGQRIEKLANKTLMVTTTTVSLKIRRDINYFWQGPPSPLFWNFFSSLFSLHFCLFVSLSCCTSSQGMEPMLSIIIRGKLPYDGHSSLTQN